MPQAVFPDRHRTPAKSEFKINKTKLFGINMSQILHGTYLMLKITCLSEIQILLGIF